MATTVCTDKHVIAGVSSPSNFGAPGLWGLCGTLLAAEALGPSSQRSLGRILAVVGLLTSF